MPSRRTFTSALQASVHCGGSGASQSLLRLLPQPARGHGQPLADSALDKPPRSSAREPSGLTREARLEGWRAIRDCRGSGLPVPRRRTIAAAFRASALSRPPALRHPCLRLSATPAPGVRAPPPRSSHPRSCRKDQNGFVLDGRDPGAGRGHAQKPVNLCDSRSACSWPAGQPVAKSAGAEHVPGRRTTGAVSREVRHPWPHFACRPSGRQWPGLLPGRFAIHPAGLEPATFGSVDRCSIQLS